MVYGRMFQYSYVPGILGLGEPYHLGGLNDHHLKPQIIISSLCETLRTFPMNCIRKATFSLFQGYKCIHVLTLNVSTDDMNTSAYAFL